MSLSLGIPLLAGGDLIFTSQSQASRISKELRTER